MRVALDEMLSYSDVALLENLDVCWGEREEGSGEREQKRGDEVVGGFLFFLNKIIIAIRPWEDAGAEVRRDHALHHRGHRCCNLVLRKSSRCKSPPPSSPLFFISLFHLPSLLSRFIYITAAAVSHFSEHPFVPPLPPLLALFRPIPPIPLSPPPSLSSLLLPDHYYQEKMMLKVMKNPYKFAYPLISKKITVDKTKREEREEREERGEEGRDKREGKMNFFSLI